MPPIPVHIDDPITPTKTQAQAETQQTSQQEGVSVPASNPANTTASIHNGAAYPSARPGAAAVPAPTPYLPQPQPAPTRTTQPTYQNSPPPPQPGAVPQPPSQHQAPVTALPPPPKAGESLQQWQAQHPTTTPPQMNIPPPQQNYAPTHSTASYIPPTSTSQQAAGVGIGGGPTTLPLGPVSLPRTDLAQHPPGYQQNAYAQDLSPQQRRSLEEQTKREGFLPSLGLDGGSEARGSGTLGSGFGGVGGGLGGTTGESASEVAGSAWNAVKAWVEVAGEKLAETEESVWKRINGK